VPAALAAVCVFNRGDLSWRRRLAAAALMLTPILACVPLLLAWTHAQYKVGHDDWEFEIPGRALRNLLIVAFGDYEVMGGTGKEIIRVVTFPLLGVSLLLLLWHRLQGRWQGQPLTEGRRLGLATVAWVGGLPIIMVVLASLKSNSVDETRYLCVTGAMMPVALAAGWWGCRSPHVRWAGIGLCIVMMLAHTAMHLWGQGDGIREAMFHLRSLGPEGNVSLAVSSSASMNAFDYYGVTMPMTPMDREELSDEEVWATCQAAIRDDTEFLHVFMFHGDDSPAPTLLRYRTPWLEHVGFETFGDSRVTTYRVLPVE
jgi:hypothetical protein